MPWPLSTFIGSIPLLVGLCLRWLGPSLLARVGGLPMVEVPCAERRLLRGGNMPPQRTKATPNKGLGSKG